MRNVLISYETTEERSGGGAGRSDVALFLRDFADDRIHYFGPTSAYWKSPRPCISIYQAQPDRRVDLASAAAHQLVCLPIDQFWHETSTQSAIRRAQTLEASAMSRRPCASGRLLMTWYVKRDRLHPTQVSLEAANQLDPAIFKLRESTVRALSGLLALHHRARLAQTR